jgi:hypothetical protein
MIPYGDYPIWGGVGMEVAGCAGVWGRRVEKVFGKTCALSALSLIEAVGNSRAAGTGRMISH